MRQRKTIVIRGDDHLGDPLGVIFLLDADQLRDTLIEKLREYLGEKIQVLKAEVSHERIEVEVEWFGFRAESDRLVDATAGLRRKRLYRSAQSMLDDALKLDPLNPRALIALGEILQGSERYAEAIAMLIRAREFGTDTPELLAMLGACCLKVERTASAIMYFERVLTLAPRHFSSRRALIGLGRKPASGTPKQEAGQPAPPSQEKPHVKH